MLTTASRLLLLLLLALLFLLSGALPSSALPIGTVVNAERGWSMGALLSVEQSDITSATPTQAGEQRANMYLSELAYGAWDNTEVFLRFGLSNDEYVHPSGAEYDFTTKIDWGLGVRGVLYDSYSGWRIVGDGQYMVRPNRTANGDDLDFKEYQISGAIELGERDDLIPYVGVTYHNMEIQTSNTRTLPWAKSKERLGVYGGVGISTGSYWKAFFEGRLVNGVALSLGIQRPF